MNEERLLELKKSIEKAKEEKARAEGERASYLKTLKTEYKVKNIREAQDLADSISDEIEELEKEIEQKLEELEAKYVW